MRKKLAVLLLAFALVFPCLFFLTSCGKDFDSAKVSSISVELVNENYALTNGKITVTYGSKVSLSPADFKVTTSLKKDKVQEVPLKTEESDGYTFESTIPAEGDVTPRGDYKLTFSCGEADAVEITVSVIKGTVNMSDVAWNYEQSKPFTYDKTQKEVELTGIPEGVSVTYDGTTKATNADTYSVVAKFSYIDADNYNPIPDMELTWVINKAVIEINSLSASSYTFDGSEHEVEFDESTLPEGVHISGISGTTSETDAGTYPVTVSFEYTGADSANYASISDLQTAWTIHKAVYKNVGSVSIVGSDELVYNGSVQSVAVDDFSGLDENVAFFGMTGETGKNVGDYTITIELLYTGTDRNYGSAESITLDWSIVPANLKVVVGDKAITYGDSVTASVSYLGFDTTGEDESVLGGSLLIDYDDYVVGSNVGEYEMTASGLSSGNYNITYEPGTLTVSKKDLVIRPNNITIDYNTAVVDHGVDVNGLVAGDVLSDLGEVNFDYDGYTVGSNAGNYDITIEENLDDTNYNIEYQTGVLLVEKIDVPITTQQIANIALVQNVFTYTGEEFEFTTASVNNETLPEGVTVTNVVVRDAEPVAVATYTLVIYLQYDGGTTNYNPMSEIERPFTIIQAEVEGFESVALQTNTFVYNGETRNVTLTNIPAGAMIKAGSENGKSGKNVNEYTYTAILVCSDTHNYIDFAPVNISLTWNITPATLTVVAKDSEITFNDDATSNGFTVTGFVNSEDEANKNDIIKGVATYDYGTYTKGSNVGNYALKVSGGLSADNYVFEYVEGGKLIVSPLEVDVSNVNWSDVQDEYTYSNGVIVRPVIENLPEGVHSTYTYSNESAEDAGTYTVNVVLSAENGNYVLTGNDGIDEFTFVINKVQVDMSGVDWVVEGDGNIYYTGEAIRVELSATSTEGVSITYEYYQDENPVEQEEGGGVVALGDYTVVVTLDYDSKNYEVLNAEFESSTTFSIIKRVLTVADFGWNPCDEITVETESAGEVGGWYNITIPYKSSYDPAITGKYINSVNILLQYIDGDEPTTEIPTFGSEIGGFYVQAQITVKEEYQNFYTVSDTLSMHLSVLVEHIPFKSLSLNGTPITFNELQSLEDVKAGSVLEFELSSNIYAMKENIDEPTTITSPYVIGENSVGSYVWLELWCEDSQIASMPINYYILDAITINGNRMEKVTSKSIEVSLSVGQKTIPVVIEGDISGLVLKYTYDNSEYIDITSNTFEIPNADQIQNSFSIYLLQGEDDYKNLVWASVEQYSPISEYIFTAVSFDGAVTEVPLDMFYSNTIYTGFVAVSREDPSVRYTNTKIFTDSTMETEVDLCDINSFADKNVYLAVFDDEGNFVAGCNNTIYYEFTANGVSLSNSNLYSAQVVYVGDASSYSFTYNVTNADLAVVATIDDLESITLTGYVTNATYKIQMTYGGKVYTFTRDVSFIKSVSLMAVASDSAVYITNTSTGLNHQVNNGNMLFVNLDMETYDAGTIRTFESNELQGLEISGLISGYAVTSKDVIEVDGMFYLVLELHYTPEGEGGALTEHDATLIINLHFVGDYNGDLSGSVEVSSMGNDTAVTTDSFTIDISRYETLSVSLNNYMAKAEIKSGDTVIKTSTYGSFHNYMFEETGTYSLVLTATNGTTKTYTITVVGEMAPLFVAVIGGQTLTQVMGEGGIPTGSFDMEYDNQTGSSIFSAYLGNGSTSLINNGKVTITSFDSSMGTGALAKNMDDTDIGEIPFANKELVVIDETTSMPYIAFYTTLEGSTSVFKFYLCAKPTTGGNPILIVQEGSTVLVESMIINGSTPSFVGQFDYIPSQEGITFVGYLGAGVWDGISQTFSLDRLATTEYAQNIFGQFYLTDVFNGNAPITLNGLEVAPVELRVGSHNDTPCVGFTLIQGVTAYLLFADDPDAGSGGNVGGGGVNVIEPLPEGTVFNLTIGGVTVDFEDLVCDSGDLYYADFSSLNSSDLVNTEGKIQATLTTSLDGEFTSVSGEVMAVTPNTPSTILIEEADGLFGFIYNGDYCIVMIFADSEM